MSADGSRLVSLVSGAAALPPFRVKEARYLLQRYWQPRSAIFPLRDYGLKRGKQDFDTNAPCGTRYLCDSAGIVPLRSFFYRVGTGPDDVRVMLLDQGATVTRGNPETKQNEAVSPRPLKLPRQLVLWRVNLGSIYDDFLGSERPPARLDQRLHITLEQTASMVRLTLDKPETMAIRRSAIVQTARDTSGNLHLEVGAAARDSGDNSASALRVPGVGGRSGQSVTGTLSLTRDSDYGRTNRSFSISSLDDPVQLDSPFALGDRKTGPVALFVLERFDPPWLLFAGVAMFLGLLWWGQRENWAANGGSFAIILTVVWLLAIRWLIGIESGFLDDSLDHGKVFGGSAVAMVMLPLVLVLVLVSPGQARKPYLWPAWMMASGLLVTAWLLYGWMTEVIPALGFLLLVATSITTAPQCFVDFSARIANFPILRWVVIATRWAITASRSVLTHVWSWTNKNSNWSLVVFLLMAVRMAFAVGGKPERLDWPFSLALSIIYVPPLLLCFANGLDKAATGKATIIPIFIIQFLAFIALLAFPYFALKDSGLVIYLIPIIAFSMALPWAIPGQSWVLKRRWLMLPVFAALVVIAAFGWLALQNNREDARLAEARELVTHGGGRERADQLAAGVLADRIAHDANLLRLDTVLAPDRLAESGTSAGESQFRVAAILADYSSSLVGRGWMHPSNPGDIRRYQADDNLSAVHLMSPFGRFGTALMVLVLGLLAWVASRRFDLATFAGVAASLSLWTLFSTAAYMVLANLAILPFTGRNIYLLSAFSVSDLIEGGMLFAIAIRVLGQKKF